MPPCADAMKRSAPDWHLMGMDLDIDLRGDRSERLVDSARRGDAAAFTAIVDVHHAEMVRVAFVVCCDVEMARDAAQNAWIKAWRGLPGLNQPSRLRPWLLSIAANEARQVARSRRRRPVRSIDALDIEPDAAGPTPTSMDLAAALGRLDPSDRALIALRYLAGVDTADLARATGRTASGTRTRLSRLLARLREDLDHA
jgi:RNA polymerase sigma-70 factor, ECF subfamily